MRPLLEWCCGRRLPLLKSSLPRGERNTTKKNMAVSKAASASEFVSLGVKHGTANLTPKLSQKSQSFPSDKAEEVTLS